MQTQETELRDLFAMQYMQACVIQRGGFNAAECYQAADEMMIERAKSQPAPDGEVKPLPFHGCDDIQTI